MRIEIPQSELDYLRDRLARTRRTPREMHDWSRGTQTDALDSVLEHWQHTFDWRAVERRLNELEHVRIDVDGVGIHAVRAGTRGATPLLLLHGWPDAFLRFERALPLLSDRFELVVPSIPGYGFSDRPAEPTGPAAVGDLLAGLMSALGHDRFGVHGGDIGSTIGEQLTLRHPERVLGLHLGDVPLHRPRGLTEAELDDEARAWLDRVRDWEVTEGAYARLQRTKPQTLAVSLDDSPAGLAAWILEKFQAWSDNGGDVFTRFSLDDVCTYLTLYWVTRTGGSSVHYYYDNAHSELGTERVEVPTAFGQFPRDILPAPRATAERWFRVERWTRFDSGGHFGPWEEPGPWAADVRAFFDQIDA